MGWWRTAEGHILGDAPLNILDEHSGGGASRSAEDVSSVAREAVSAEYRSVSAGIQRPANGRRYSSSTPRIPVPARRLISGPIRPERRCEPTPAHRNSGSVRLLVA
jgi:hypothetical protein